MNEQRDRDPRRWLEDGGLPTQLRGDLANAVRVQEAGYPVAEGLARFNTGVATERASGWRRWVIGGTGLAVLAALVTAGSFLARPRVNDLASHGASTVVPAADIVSESPPEPTPVVVATTVSEAAPPAPSSRKVSTTRAAPAATRDDTVEEYQQLARVRSLAATDPAAAVRAAAEGDRQYPHGLLHQEREAVAINALVRLGRTAEAQRRAETFLRAYPNGPFSERVRALTQ